MDNPHEVMGQKAKQKVDNCMDTYKKLLDVFR
jgi:hypothetical protein